MIVSDLILLLSKLDPTLPVIYDGLRASPGDLIRSPECLEIQGMDPGVSNDYPCRVPLYHMEPKIQAVVLR